MADDAAKKPDPLASLALPVTPMIAGLVRAPYRRGDYARAALQRVYKRHGRTGSR